MGSISKSSELSKSLERLQELEQELQSLTEKNKRQKENIEYYKAELKRHRS